MGPCVGASWGPLGASWGRTASPPGFPGAVSGRKARIIGSAPPSGAPLGAVLELSWAALGASWAALAPSWANLGASWGPLGPPWDGHG
eukprot:1444712-Pyramimonas_sp.AAC.1